MSPSTRVATFAPALLACALAAPAVAQAPATTQWIVTAADATGAGGERFVSSVFLYNPNEVDAPAEVSFLPQSDLDASGRAPGDNSAVRSETVVVPAGRTTFVDTAPMFRASRAGAGGIRVVSGGKDPQGRALPIAAYSVTASFREANEREVRESLGPFIPGLGPGQLVSVGETGRVPRLLTGQSLWTSYRSNLFLLSANAEAETVVELTLVDWFGESRGTKVVTLARLAQTQVNDVGPWFDYQVCAKGCPSDAPIPESFDVVVTVRSGGPVAAGGVVIERENGSGTYAPALLARAP